MVSKSSGKRLHIQPQQFDLLLATLETETPPKTQTVFSVKQVVARLHNGITQSLENHYSFDELALIIQTSLVELDIADEAPDLKGSTLRQYYLEVKREQQSAAPRKRQSTRRNNASTGKSKTPKSVTEKRDRLPRSETVESPIEKRLPSPTSATIELAY